MSRAENINPEILVWARESAGLTLAEAAARLGLKDGKHLTGAAKLSLIESGERQPTRTQLAKYSAVYRRPLITFYLKSPPTKGARAADFRTATGTHPTAKDEGLLDALLRDVRSRQEMIVDLLESNEDVRVRDFVGSAEMKNGVAPLINSISEELGFDYTKKDLRKGDADDLFRELRRRAEGIGVFVLLIGDLGSYHTAISSDVFRGFTIADKTAPFVVINDQDARSSRSFTLIHELAHLWLGESAVSGSPDPGALPQSEVIRTERFCDDVASQFLLPPNAVADKPTIKENDKPAAERSIAAIASQWSVSEPMVAYRFNRLGWITTPLYRDLVAGHSARWRAAKQSEKDKTKESDGGPSYYVIRQHRLGDAILDVVRQTLRDNTLTHTKAAKVLGVKPSSVEPLLQAYKERREKSAEGTRG
jgi:Zn-dependent peptidase ImmA (M78 family)/transcriptional regulator with XRE-family HTH domain